MIASFNLGIPNLLVEAYDTAVKSVFAIVNSQGIVHAVQSELALADTVAKATDSGTQVAVIDFITFHGVITQDNILYLAVLVGNTDGTDDAAIVQNLHFHALAVLECVGMYLPAVSGFSEHSVCLNCHFDSFPFIYDIYCNYLDFTGRNGYNECVNSYGKQGTFPHPVVTHPFRPMVNL